MKQHRILITDDTIFTRTMLRSVLSANGFDEIIEAGDGQEAIDKYKAHSPHVVLMDITMPVKDGIAALEEIREFDPQARVIMCTAMGQKNMIDDAIRAGAVDLIVKPFQTNRELESVRKALEMEAA
jgi:two-component system chemotaxis response regulator CheY